MTEKISTSETWKELNGGVWRVVKLSETHVGLSGPGPCRSYREVSLDTFLKTFTKVK